MLPDRILLVDVDRALVRHWDEVFADVDQLVEVREADYFSVPADAMVSPANSFGIMDGGLDAAIRDALGFAVEKSVQRAIVDRHHGELVVGAAEVVETGHQNWPYLVVAPTMRVPEGVGQTLNPYLAFRAALLAVKGFNQRAGNARIRSLLCCGLGSGIGGVDARRCAVQMRMALKQALGPGGIPSFAGIRAMHHALRTA